MATSPILATCACAKPVSPPPCAAPARSIYEMLSDSEHSADTIAALAAAAELQIDDIERSAGADVAGWVSIHLSDTHKLLRLIRREALALAEVISDVELACRPLALGDVPDVVTELRAARETIAAERDGLVADNSGAEHLDCDVVPFVERLDRQLARIDAALGTPG